MRSFFTVASRTGLLALAAAAAPVFTGPALAAIVVSTSGVWVSDGAQGARLEANFIVGPGNFDVKWSSLFPIDQTGFLDANLEIRDRLITYDGVVLQDNIFGSDAGVYFFPVGVAGGYIHGFSVPEDQRLDGPDFYELLTFRKGGRLLLHAGADAIGTPWSLTVSDVPEPATWAMMIAGFGLTGLALRRRTAALAPTRGRC
ncbi:MAG TPA: PEPxxWA-CTERM sorting domain-containing protein [Phenylobacterium sp.]|nr:PEPxxWA-CTERM sorting domain-containing protein [Phenylobacterium sp.]